MYICSSPGHTRPYSSKCWPLASFKAKHLRLMDFTIRSKTEPGTAAGNLNTHGGRRNLSVAQRAANPSRWMYDILPVKNGGHFRGRIQYYLYPPPPRSSMLQVGFTGEGGTSERTIFCQSTLTLGGRGGRFITLGIAISTSSGRRMYASTGRISYFHRLGSSVRWS